MECRHTLLDRVSLRWPSVALLLVVVSAVLLQAFDLALQRSDVGAEILNGTAGVGEILLGVIVLLAMIRNERKRGVDTGA